MSRSPVCSVTGRHSAQHAGSDRMQRSSYRPGRPALCIRMVLRWWGGCGQGPACRPARHFWAASARRQRSPDRLICSQCGITTRRPNGAQAAVGAGSSLGCRAGRDVRQTLWPPRMRNTMQVADRARLHSPARSRAAAGLPPPPPAQRPLPPGRPRLADLADLAVSIICHIRDEIVDAKTLVQLQTLKHSASC